MIEKNISYSDYLDMVNRINKFSQEKGRMPNYVDICGVRVYKPEYDDAILRVLKFKNIVGRWPNSVLIKGDSLVQKTELWRGLEKSLGKTFDNPEQLAEALRNHPDYEYYYKDKVYAKGRKVSEKFKENMKIVFDEFLGKWNYTAIPTKKSEVIY